MSSLRKQACSHQGESRATRKLSLYPGGPAVPPEESTRETGSATLHLSDSSCAPAPDSGGQQRGAVWICRIGHCVSGSGIGTSLPPPHSGRAVSRPPGCASRSRLGMTAGLCNGTSATTGVTSHSMCIRIVAVLLPLFVALAQTPEELEKRLGRLDPERRAYERYRFWITSQPPAVQRSPNQMDQYRDYLKKAGFSAADIERQIRTVQQQGRRLEVERWNDILTAERPRFNTKPNAFLVEIASGRKPGTALDVGMGQGRNAVWLAQNGWRVTGFDPAERAVALALQNASKRGVKLTTEIKGAEDFDFGENRWDLIVLSYVGVRGISDKVQRGLRPGGIVVLEAFHRDATRGRSIGRGVVFDSGELPALFLDLRVVRYEEPMATGDFGQERVRLVRFCAEKPSE